jgi:hypothetical protein
VTERVDQKWSFVALIAVRLNASNLLRSEPVDTIYQVFARLCPIMKAAVRFILTNG